ncbi:MULTISPECIES: hypothetical protein [unclassified Lentimicrobium]|uniref:hypothetical protein n=1 Tax=unclassified Lentimicrobium TaxID=2677434 RepID=UPI00155383A9|nr:MULTISPECIES: hypothetical protein [unclassified Lentimicrobium]NPD47656.1 hypothetical protein [Lentimicrobium sp. S6]NPD86610.1 hypothetical protein [Lentimicrobium sp. L6]
MSVDIIKVSSKSDYKAFAKLPFEIYKGNAYWVPPIIKDEIKSLNPLENPAMDYCDSQFWLAKKEGKVVGRIGAIINKKYNEKLNEKLGRFSRLEFYDDAEVFQALMDTAVNWLKERGMNKAHGPLGFSNLDTQGMLIEGFDHLASVASVYHMPYYQTHLDKYGFRKENDWVEFRLTLGERARQKGIRGSQLIKKRYGFEVVRFEKTDELKPYVKDIFAILNDAFDKLPYVTPFNEKMIDLYAEKYFKVINPKYVAMVKKEERIVGFVVAVPSLSEAMQKANGKLFPLGFTHVLKAMKNPKVLDFFLTGVVPEYDNAGVAVILFSEIQDEMLGAGIDQMETTGIFETNHNVISNWKNYEHIQHKRRRCYIKEI